MVLVFKTTIFQQMELHVRALLDSFSTIKTVDFDFEDCDIILRVEAKSDISLEIEHLLNSNGFDCKELL